MASSTGRFIWHDLITTDVDAAKAFYGELLGWTYAVWTAEQGNPAPADAPEYPMIVAGAGSMPQGGIMLRQDPMVPPHWLGHIALPGVDEVAARVEPAGGQVMFGPFDIPGVGRDVAIADPEGAVFAVVTFGGDGMYLPDGARPEGSFVWDELIANDIEGAKAFYAAVTGWGAEGWPGGEVPYTLFMAGEAQAGGLMARPDGMQMPPAWLTYVNVADAAAAAAKVTALGGTVYAGPFEVPTIGWIAVIGDPQGAVLGLIQPNMRAAA